MAEIEHAYHHLGIRGFWARPDEFNHRTLGDRYYDPVWELLQDLDVPFSTHEFMGLRGNSFGSDRFRGYSEWHTVVHPFEAMGAIVSMICHGVYERFPRLRVAYLEAGCGWLPSWLHRIDEHLEAGRGPRVPRAHHVSHRLLQVELLDLHRVRGPLRQRRHPRGWAMATSVRVGLPAPRLEVSPCQRDVLEPAPRADQR